MPIYSNIIHVNLELAKSHAEQSIEKALSVLADVNGNICQQTQLQYSTGRAAEGVQYHQTIVNIIVIRNDCPTLGFHFTSKVQHLFQ